MEINITEYSKHKVGKYWVVEIEVETPYQTIVIQYCHKKLNDALRTFYKRVGSDIGVAIHDDVIAAVYHATKNANNLWRNS